MTTNTGNTATANLIDSVKARLAGLGDQAFACWEFLLDGDFGDAENQLILDAAELALAGDPLPEQTIRALQAALVELAENFSLNLRHFGPFIPGNKCSAVGVKRMVVLIATQLAAREQDGAFLAKFRKDFPDAIGKDEARIRCHTLAIDKSTGHTVNC